MKKVSKKIITICASATHFRKVLDIEEQLKKLGFKVKIPKTAALMKKSNDFNIAHYKTWIKNENDYHKKTKLIKGHFKKVVESDAILVVNYEKNGIKGNIGGNTLMEMTVAFLNNKPIFVLNPIDENLGIKEEVYGLNSIFIEGNLELIKKGFK